MSTEGWRTEEGAKWKIMADNEHQRGDEQTVRSDNTYNHTLTLTGEKKD